MKFEEVFKFTGHYGRYHRLLTHIVCFVLISNTFSNIGTIFLNGSMDHFCKHEDDEPTYTNCSVTEYECGFQNLDLPRDDESTSFIDESMCRKYLFNDTDTVKCDQGWTYDTSTYKSTIISEFDLVCENSYKVSLSASSFLFGYFFGSLIFGTISDYFGRKCGIIVANVSKILTGIGCALAPSYWTYFVFRMLNGATNIGLYICVFVYVTEMVASNKRARVSAIVYIYWCIGFFLLAVVAYNFRSWRQFYLFVSLCPVPFAIIYLFIPESPRWLLLKNRPEAAKRILYKIAKFNKKEISDEVFEDIDVLMTDQSQKVYVWKVFKYPNMRKKTLVLFVCWMTASLVYYGLTYGIEALDVDIYVGVAISGVTEFLAAISIWFAIEKFGRRLMLVFGLNIAGILCLINVMIPENFGKARTAISILGRFFMTTAFSLIYTYTGELYSTDVRGLGLGICSFMSRISGVVAPQILFLQKLWTPLPFVTFSITSVASGLLALLLPETLNFPLPHTVEEAELVTRFTNRRKGIRKEYELKVEDTSTAE